MWQDACTAYTGGYYMTECSHLGLIRNVRPRTRGCEECLKTGDVWVHLRLCLTCGHVGCCDTSKNKHATKHFHQTQHPIMRSFEPGEDWGWYYVDEVMLDSRMSSLARLDFRLSPSATCARAERCRACESGRRA